MLSERTRWLLNLEWAVELTMAWLPMPLAVMTLNMSEIGALLGTRRPTITSPLPLAIVLPLQCTRVVVPCRNLTSMNRQSLEQSEMIPTMAALPVLPILVALALAAPPTLLVSRQLTSRKVGLSLSLELAGNVALMGVVHVQLLIPNPLNDMPAELPPAAALPITTRFPSETTSTCWLRWRVGRALGSAVACLVRGSWLGWRRFNWLFWVA